MRSLASTISKFDVVAVQEIKDASQESVKRLKTDVDKFGTDYGCVPEPRLG